MMLKDFLLKLQPEVLKRWLHLILETYPPDGPKSIGQGKDRFNDPVGYRLTHALEALYDGLLQGIAAEQSSVHLDQILQIRSVQHFSPSQAVAIVPLIKSAIREEIKRNGIEIDQMVNEWFDLESRIDQLSLLAFDSYSKYRDRINEIRINEIRKERDRALKLLERSGAKSR